MERNNNGDGCLWILPVIVLVILLGVFAVQIKDTSEKVKKLEHRLQILELAS